MTKRYLQEKYSLDDEECAPEPNPYRRCPECKCYGGRHTVLCPNTPDEPEQDGEE